MRRVTERLPALLRKRVKIARVRTFEAVGSTRYSWPALNRLDRQMVARLPDTGTFLEVGGNDGYSQSNTYYLERHLGWSGVLIEPLPALAAMARAVRPRSEVYSMACADPVDAGRPVSLADNDLMSVLPGVPNNDTAAARIAGTRPTVNVAATTMSAVIDHSSFERITFMSVDVEGAELPLLAGLDLDRHTPDFLLVETKHPEDVAAAVPTMTLVDQLSHHDYLFTRD